jgi:signal peptidase I
VAAALFLLLLLTFALRPYSIPSISMIPTLQVNDTVLVDELSYRFHGPHFGDLAVFEPPVPSSAPFIKRVIGLPGDAIRIHDGVLYRNGAAITEPYVNEAPSYDLSVENDTIVVDGEALSSRRADIPPKRMWQYPNRIPEGFYLVLGDNRNYSEDSHTWGFAQFSGRFASGPLAGQHRNAKLIGRAVMVLWPLDHMRILN